jgi:hypothetical protein
MGTTLGRRGTPHEGDKEGRLVRASAWGRGGATELGSYIGEAGEGRNLICNGRFKLNSQTSYENLCVGGNTRFWGGEFRHNLVRRVLCSWMWCRVEVRRRFGRAYCLHLQDRILVPSQANNPASSCLLLAGCSTLKMELVGTSETSASFYHTT